MVREEVRGSYKRNDYIKSRHCFLNLSRIFLVHALLFFWVYFSYEYLPLPLFVFFSCAISLVHQRELSEWIHEASHYNLHRDKKLNDILIHLSAGYFFANDILVHRAGHLVHHRVKHFFNDQDPDTRLLVIESKKHLLFEVLKDLCGVTALRMFFLRAPDGLKTPLKTPFFLFKVALFQIALLTGFWFFDRIPSYFIYYITLLTLYPLMNRLRLYGQHLKICNDGVVRMDKSDISRTIKSGPLDGIFFTSGLMKYHYEHHSFPDLPFRAIKKISKVYDDPNKYKVKRFDLYYKFYKGLP